MDMIKLLELMVKHEASDLYLTAEAEPMYRIEGFTRPAGSKKLQSEQVKDLLYSIMNDKQIAEFEDKKEINLALQYAQLGRFRINGYVQRDSVATVVRRIKSDIFSIKDLGLPDVLEDVSLLKRGLVLVVGATGSGKSTTLASMINHRNLNQTGHIITIEDPIEFIYDHKKSIVSQREVGMDTDSYQSALKNALRQAPDVVLLGEIRDKETMEQALIFAETGHLCLATLHSNNAYQAIERIMNFFPPVQHKQIYMQLSLNLRGIISQRLISSVDGGRVAAMEIMLDTPRIKDLINKGEVVELREAIEKSSQFGMQTFDQSLYDLYKSDQITLEEGLKNADSANNLRLRVKLDDEDDYGDKGNKSKEKEASKKDKKLLKDSSLELL